MPNVQTPIVRLSFARLFKPQADDKGNLKYSAALIFPKNPTEAYKALGLNDAQIAKQVEQMKALEKTMAEVAIEYFGGKEKVLPGIKNKDLGKGTGYPFRDQGTSYDKSGNLNAGYEPGGIYLNVSSKNKPAVVGLVKNAEGKYIPLEESEIWSGDWVRVSLSCYGYNQQGNKGVSFGLNNVQLIRKGEKLGGGQTSAESDFEDDLDLGDAEESADSLF